MVKYLQMDGVDDYLKTPSLTIDSVAIECLIVNDATQPQYGSNPFLIDARFGGKYFKYNNTGGYVTSTGITSVNGLTKDARITIIFNFTSMTNTVNFFSANTGSLNVKGNIYKITCSLGGVTKAIYDMSTGTVNDISGNGNHATLNGGTWLDDGTGGTPTGTDGSTAFDLKQYLYRDASTIMDSKLSLYVDSSISADTKQLLYQDTSFASDSKQLIYSDSATAYDSIQSLYQDFISYVDTKQSVYQDNSTLFDTLQEFFSDGVIGSIPFDMRLVIYNDNTANFDSRQSMYMDGLYNLDLEQKLYALGLSNVDLKLVIYKDSNILSDLRQQIYKDNIDIFDLNQSLFLDGNVPFDLRNELYQQTFIMSDLHQSIYQDNTIELQLLQQIYEVKNINFDTLQMILDGFSEYQQVLRYVLQIVQKSNYNLNINDLPMQFHLGIVQKLHSDMELAGSKKSFDLKI